MGLGHAAACIPGTVPAHDGGEALGNVRQIAGHAGRARARVCVEQARHALGEFQRFIGGAAHQCAQQVTMLGDGLVRWRSRMRRRSAVIAEARAQPGIEMRLEAALGVSGLDDGGPGVEPGFHGIGHQELATEAVNRRAGQVVERARGVLQALSLLRDQSMRQHFAQHHGDRSGEQFVHQARDALAELCGGGLGEGDGGDACRMGAGSEQHRGACGEERRLAGAGARLDEERVPQCGERGAPCGGVGEEGVHVSGPPGEA